MGRIKGVFSKDFGRSRQWGEADSETGYIYISPKCKGIKDLEIRLHEGIHIHCPYFSESEVEIIGADFSYVMGEWLQEAR